jgi:SAM-dependent methyltransferase
LPRPTGSSGDLAPGLAPQGASPHQARTDCPLCANRAHRLCSVTGRTSGRSFELRRCPSCRFVFVSNPWLEFEEIYDERYYDGDGADPFVNYRHDADHPDTTIRRHEWQGILERVGSLTRLDTSTRWLDYGCGTGGLVAWLRHRGLSGARGYEQGYAARQLRERSVPGLSPDELKANAGTFDVVTAIEVIEHTVDPVHELWRMRSLLRPGGLLFLTTGNAAPFRKRIASWRYVVPEVHISFFEPETLSLALELAGFVPECPGYGPGWNRIIRYKLLRALGREDLSRFERAVPWSMAAWLVDRRLKLSAQPVGWAPCA